MQSNWRLCRITEKERLTAEMAPEGPAADRQGAGGEKEKQGGFNTQTTGPLNRDGGGESERVGVRSTLCSWLEQLGEQWCPLTQRTENSGSQAGRASSQVGPSCCENDVVLGRYFLPSESQKPPSALLAQGRTQNITVRRGPRSCPRLPASASSSFSF